MSKEHSPEKPKPPEPGLWKNRNYRLIFGATSVSNLGDGIAMVAYPWLATMISRDPLDIAFVAFASRLPWFLVSLPAAGMVKGVNQFASYEITLRTPYFILGFLYLPVIAYVFKTMSNASVDT